MFKFLIIAMGALCAFYPREAITSQVMYVDSGIQLDQMINYPGTHVVIVKPSDKWETYLEKEIKQKPGLPPPEIPVYKEVVQVFEVVSVLKSETLKAGQIVKVWKQSAYDYETMKKMYEQQMNITMASQRYNPVNPPVKDENLILILGDKEPEKSVYGGAGEEGMASLPEIERIIKTPTQE